MENRGRGRLHGVAVLAALAAVAAIAAVWTGTSAASSKAATNPFAHYGNITLNVWSADNQDPGPKPVIEGLAKTFEKKYPNVTITPTYDPDNVTTQNQPRQLASATPPDLIRVISVTAGVKNGLLTNLDSYASAYGWDKLPTSQLSQFRAENGVAGACRHADAR